MVHEANKPSTCSTRPASPPLSSISTLPFDEDALLDVINESGGRIITVEDNYGGGIGSAVADAVTTSGDGFTLRQMHVRRIPKSLPHHR